MSEQCKHATNIKCKYSVSRCKQRLVNKTDANFFPSWQRELPQDFILVYHAPKMKEFQKTE